MLNQQSSAKVANYKEQKRQLPKDVVADDKILISGMIQEILQSNLNLTLTEDRLSSLATALSQLYVNELNDEQNRLKGFLYTFAKHLRDLAKYLKLFGDRHALTKHDVLKMEHEIQKNIYKISRHMNNVMLSKELMKEISAKLQEINVSVELYKEKVQNLLQDQQQDMLVLQDKLIETERGANKIKNMLSLERLRNNQDLLTGIANRSAYDERIKDAYNRWQRGFGDLSLVIADIDNFKKINETYGHLAGDKVLKDVAHIFRTSIRAVDFVAHYGGGEFVFIFERTRTHDAMKVAEVLSNVVAEYDYTYYKSEISLTMSFGVSGLQHGDDAGSLFKRADQALYQAKCTGGNCGIMI